MKITKITIIIIIFALSFVTAIENNKENVVQLGGRTIKSFDNEKMADNMQTFLRDIPRYDFSLQRISNTFAPLSLDYYESLILIAAPFFGMGVLSILIGVVMITIGVCCIAFFPRKEGGYSSFSRLFPSFILIIFSIVILLCMGIGFYSEVEYHSSFYSAFSTVENITSYEMNLVNETLTSINEYNGMGSDLIHSSIPDNLPQWSSSFSNFTSLLFSLTDRIIYPIENTRNVVIMSVFMIITIGVVGAVMGAAMRWGKFAYLLLLIFLISISLCWLFSSFNVFLSVFLSDLCPVIDEGIENGFPSSVSDYVNFYLFCEGNGYDLFFPLPEAIDSSVIALQISLSQTNGNSTLEKILERDLNELKEIQSNMTALLQCSPTSSAFNSTQTLICVNLFDGLFAITAMEVSAGVMMSVCVYLLILGIRRWNYPKNSSSLLYPPLLSSPQINVDSSHVMLNNEDRYLL